MDRSALLRQLMDVFLVELDEHVRATNRDLLALEGAPGGEVQGELLRGLLRTTHSLKGAARAVGIAPIEGLCHSLESLLDEVCGGRRALDKELFKLLFASADALQDAGGRLREGRELAGAPIEAAVARAKSSVGNGGAAPPVVAARPSPPPLPAPSSTMPSAKVASPRDTSPREAAGTVRVAARKLDTLLTQAGELSMLRASLREREGELGEIEQLCGRFLVEWQRAERPLRKLLASTASHDAGSARAARALDRAGQLAERIDREIERVAAAMTQGVRTCEKTTHAIDAEVHAVRMLPFAEACQGIGRAARDLAEQHGKLVDVCVVGSEVELDRSILEGLKDPLLHLVRNAVDHGIEPPAARRAAGKSERGRIEIAATLRGAQVEVTVSDDGKGLDVASIMRAARERGLSPPDAPAELVSLVFLPGFSTSRVVTVVSGRGVGLDVVKTRVEALHGQVAVMSTPGQGVRFVLTLPLTVTTLRAVLVEAAGQTFAFPATSVDRVAHVKPGELGSAQGRPVLLGRGAPLPVASLADLLGLPGRELSSGAVGAPLLVVSGRGRTVGLLCDAFASVDEILVKNLGRRLRRVRFISGAATLPMGTLALILSPGELCAAAARRGAATTLPRPLADTSEAAPKRRILVVDDSVTTRSLGKSILEAAGFEVMVAADGQEALRLLEERGADLVVSDVEMPRMDGLSLTEAIRASRRFQHLPIVLMTGLGSDRDKARGLEAGADAYLVKSAFDQAQLLDTIAQLL